jgi:hypothetical protein
VSLHTSDGWTMWQDLDLTGQLYMTAIPSDMPRNSLELKGTASGLKQLVQSLGDVLIESTALQVPRGKSSQFERRLTAAAGLLQSIWTTMREELQGLHLPTDQVGGTRPEIDTVDPLLFGVRIDVWVNDATFPLWRAIAVHLQSLGVDVDSGELYRFIADFLAIVSRLLRYANSGTQRFQHETSLPIERRDWNLTARAVSTKLQPIETSSTRELRIRGEFSQFVELFQRGSSELVSLMRRVPDRE